MGLLIMMMTMMMLMLMLMMVLCSPDIVSSLNWTTLGTRRLFAQAQMFYKIRHNLVNISFPADVKENPRQTRSNPYKYRQLQSNELTFTYSFFPRTVRTWNSLPASVASARQKPGPNLRSALIPSERHSILSDCNF